MRAMVLLANPDPDSLCHAIAARVRAGLEAGGHEVRFHDLSAEGFRAAMSPEERAAYHGDHPVLDPLVQQHIDEVKWADTLIVVYPTWWSGMPAVLKGWFERVMVPGVGFVFDDQHRVRPGITNLKRLMGISTYGSKWWYVKLINDNGRRTLLRAMRPSTGLRTRTRWMGLYSVDTSTPAQRAAFLAKCEAAVANW